MREKQIRTRIVASLKCAGWLVVPYPNTGYGLVGFPDLIAVKDGRTVYIEVKAKGGRVSPRQAAVHRLLEKHGATVIVATCVDSILETIGETGCES